MGGGRGGEVRWRERGRGQVRASRCEECREGCNCGMATPQHLADPQGVGTCVLINWNTVTMVMGQQVGGKKRKPDIYY